MERGIRKHNRCHEESAVARASPALWGYYQLSIQSKNTILLHLVPPSRRSSCEMLETEAIPKYHPLFHIWLRVRDCSRGKNPVGKSAPFIAYSGPCYHTNPVIVAPVSPYSFWRHIHAPRVVSATSGARIEPVALPSSGRLKPTLADITLVKSQVRLPRRLLLGISIKTYMEATANEIGPDAILSARKVALLAVS